jgi:hypothetical protein
VLQDKAVYFEHVQVIRCDIKPRSVKRSNDIPKWDDFKSSGTPFSHSATHFKILFEAIDVIIEVGLQVI